MSNALLSHTFVSLLAEYGLRQLITHSFSAKYNCCPPAVFEHDVQAVGVLFVQVFHTGLHAGQDLVDAS